MAFTAAKNEAKKKQCPICGKEKSIATNFYKSSSPLFSIDGCVPVCINCVKQDVLNDDGTVNKNRLKTMCQRLDKPFYIDELDNAFLQAKSEYGYLSDDEVAKQGRQIIGFYFKNINTLRQNQNKSFADSEKDSFTHRTSNVGARQKKDKDVKETRIVQPVEIKSEDVTWTKKDKQNMKYVISTVGYDPFEDISLSETDKKYCFNIMSGYCELDDIKDDGNKRLACIRITTLQLQCQKIDELISKELLLSEPNEQKISKLTSTKSQLLGSISTLCKDNNIASAYNGSQKAGKNTLTQKMQDMFADGIESVKVNLFDIETSKYMKQVADCSNRSILDQLNFDSNEYTQMIKEQREMIQELQSELDRLKEEYRICNNELIELRNQRKGR